MSQWTSNITRSGFTAILKMFFFFSFTDYLVFVTANKHLALVLDLFRETLC